MTATVSDNGPGIDPAILPRLFEPFASTRLDARGTGLGLAICREILDHHRGRIDVASEVGRGTTFTLLLPRVQPASVAA